MFLVPTLTVQLPGARVAGGTFQPTWTLQGPLFCPQPHRLPSAPCPGLVRAAHSGLGQQPTPWSHRQGAVLLQNVVCVLLPMARPA